MIGQENRQFVLQEDVRSALESAPVCYLATCCEGVPNVVAIGFKWLVGDNLLIADLFFDKTRRNLAANPTVAVTVAFTDPKRGFQLKGTALVQSSGEHYEQIKTLLRQVGVDADPHGVVVISLKEAYCLDPGPEAGKRIT